jgi:glycosyltransferase involved in cell wall biosynthesis
MNGTYALSADAAPTTRRGAFPRIYVAIYMRDLAGGGVERQTVALASELQANGVSVTLLLHRAVGELRAMVPDDIRIVDMNSRRTLEDVWLVARFLRKERPDVLLSNLDHNNVAAALANLLAGRPSQVVICQHNPVAAPYFWSLSWSYRLIPLAYRLLSPCVSRAVAVSGGIVDEMHKIAHIPRRKVALIHNPVIGADFQFRAAQSVTHPWFENRDEPVFVTAGRLVAMKDHETLLRALAIHRRHHGGRLLVLGIGPLRAHLGNVVNELGLQGCVDFLDFQENPLPWFRRSDAFVLSSYSEGFGNVLVEAMGCGTPVISTDCEHGPAEILDNGRFGLLVPPKAPEALAAAMGNVAELRSLWPSSMLKARAAEFNTAACAAAYLQLFRAVGAFETRDVIAA